MMGRREFVSFLGSAACWPCAVRAQQPVPRVAVILVQHEGDPLGQARLNAFLKAFESLGWRDGRNVRIDLRWAGGSAERMREISADFVALKPQVIVASGSPAVAALKRATSSIPVVFVAVNEPVAQGFVASLARPGGNITGFTQTDFSIVGKSVHMLKAIAPKLNRIGLMYNPETYGFYDAYLARFQAEARWPMELKRVAVRVPSDIDPCFPGGRRIGRNGRRVQCNQSGHDPKGTAGLSAAKHSSVAVIRGERRTVVIRTRRRGHLSRSADYVDRILKGAIPAELPVQAPTGYELAINLKAAKLLGLDVPQSLLAIANEVIE
jgi:putative tryptophan/tyrosine transport system substrate-binding protein